MVTGAADPMRFRAIQAPRVSVTHTKCLWSWGSHLTVVKYYTVRAMSEWANHKAYSKG